MSMRLYNSLISDIAEFVPLNEAQITIYSCGPTVYDNAHIGNLSSYVYADTLKRVLTRLYPGRKIIHVMNITDIDDKTIAKSIELYPEEEPLIRLKKVTSKYEELFLGDIRKLGIDTKDIILTRATEYIPQMQQLIKKLVEAKFAYVADDGIYFSITAYKSSGKNYGQLVNITAESTGAARVNNDEYDKDSIHDFVLWKLAKPGEPAWDFEIGGKQLKGRPGWHIECSAMSVDKLGIPFDIHTGGVDLKFPHHENEIAQSTAIGDNNLLARFFVHSEHMLVDDVKMAKSSQNFFTLKDITDKGIDPLSFRLFVLQSHYRNQSHFSWVNLEAANDRLDRIRRVVSLRPITPKTQEADSSNSPDNNMILEGISDDLNLAIVLEAIEAELSLFQQDTTRAGLDQFISEVDKLLGLNLATSLMSRLTDHQIELIHKREQAREAADWPTSDKLRNELVNQGIGIRDSVEGTIWYQL